MTLREVRDDTHPLGIVRVVGLWTNPGDVVLSPFAGIGSEGYVSVLMGRRFVGCELKASYYRQMVGNLARAVEILERPTMFDLADAGGE